MKRILLFLALVACGPSYERTEIDQVTTGRLQGVVTTEHIRIAEGSVVTARITPYDDNHHDLTSHVRSLDESRLTVTPMITDHGYAFYGLHEGRAQVEVKADDHVVLVIDAEIVPQPASF